jgi:SulP family sulfate permease
MFFYIFVYILTGGIMLNFIKEKLNIKNEVLAGLTVALALVPEAVAFSFVAGVKPLTGLYAAFIMGIVTSLIGGRPGMISGATGAIAVVLAPLAKDYGVEYIFAAVILMGIIQVVAGALKLGKFARIIPHPVMLGFVNGLAIVIFLAQLGQFKVENELGKMVWMGGNQLYIMLGLVGMTMAIIHFLPKFTKAVPSSLVAIGATTALSIKLRGLGFAIPTVRDFAKGGISGGFPSLHLPQVSFSMETLEIIMPFAITAALVGLIESLLTLALVDEVTDTRGKSNKECIGQGVANLLNGFFGGMGGCAMIGQSMINVNSGGRSRLSSATAAISLLIFIMFGSAFIEGIPLAALVGVMFMVVIGTFEWESLSLGKKVPFKDILIIIIVAVITVLHDLALAVIVGIIISALIFAWEKGKRISAEIKIDEDGCKIYMLEGPLFFGSAANFKDIFDVQNDPKVVKIDFVKSSVRDHSAIEAINNITDKYKQAGKKLKLKHLSKDCYKLLKDAEEIIEVNIVEDPKYFVADNKLA